MAGSGEGAAGAMSGREGECRGPAGWSGTAPSEGRAERARVVHRWQEEAPETAQEASQGDGRGEGRAEAWAGAEGLGNPPGVNPLCFSLGR